MRVLPIWSRHASIYLLSLLSIQCRTLPSAAVKSQSVPDEAFSHAKVTDIQLKLDPTAWDNLRLEGNNLSNLQCGAKTKSEYSQVPADVTIDGKSYGTVKIRKKGFFGSLLQAKPSLKIKFPADAPALFFGLNRIVLNNNNQDPALIRQCLAYDLFRAANISSPRCSFARLHVNGKDLGIYTHVEEFSSSFVEKNFGNPNDVLVEGTLSDFSENFSQSFDVKNGDSSLAQAKIKAISDILSNNPPDLLEQLDAHINLEQFFRFWATEVLIAHWDGYANNRNNYYFHINPQTGKIDFVPWGADAVFSAADPFYKSAEPRPTAISAKSKLTNAIFNHPEGKKRYLETLKILLHDIWKPAEIKQSMSRMRQVLGEEVLDFSYQNLSAYIDTRADAIQRELSLDELRWKQPYSEKVTCITEIGNLEAEFSSSWLGEINPKTPGGGSGTLNFTINGETLNFKAIYSLAGTASSIIRPQPALILMAQGADASYIAQIYLEQGLFQDATTINFQGFSTFGALIKITKAGLIEQLGLISTGTVRLEKASAKTGAAVSGSLKAKVYSNI